MNEGNDRSATSLVGDLVHHVTELLRKELQLLRAELGETANQVFAACGMLAASLVIAIVSLNVLAAALVAAVAALGIETGWAALIVGVALALIAFGLAAKGRSDLKASNLTPERTARSLSKDAALAKERTP